MANINVVVKTARPGGTTGAPLTPLLTTDVYRIPNTGNTMINVRKTGAGACVMTIVTPGTVDGQAVADRTINIPATTGNVWISGLNPSVYNVPGQNYIEVTFDEVTGLSLEVFESSF